MHYPDNMMYFEDKIKKQQDGLDITMKPTDFNETSQISRYSYTRSPVDPRAFLILRKDEEAAGPRPVGDYTVLDREEDIDFAEKKVMNFIASLNGKEEKVIDLSTQSDSTLHFRVLSEKDEENMSKLMFYKQSGKGVSAENALVRVEYDEKVWN